MPRPLKPFSRHNPFKLHIDIMSTVLTGYRRGKMVVLASGGKRNVDCGGKSRDPIWDKTIKIIRGKLGHPL